MRRRPRRAVAGTLFNVGDTGSSMYILLLGKLVGFTRDGAEVKVLEPGTVFGELAALRLNKERTLTIKARCVAVVYTVRTEPPSVSSCDSNSAETRP